MSRLTLLVLSSIAMLFCSALRADTFAVTSSSCDGPGSIKAAIDQANTNPGTDTISIEADISNVNAPNCGVTDTNDADDYFMVSITDDLIIEGNGRTITGNSRWVTDDGRVNRPGLCPKNTLGTTITSQPVGLAFVDDADVTINFLNLDFLRAIANLTAGSSLTLNNMEARKIFDFYGNCDNPAIKLVRGSTDIDVTINNSLFADSWNDALVLFGNPNGRQIWSNAYIAGVGADGTLTILDSVFGPFQDIPVFDWAGTAYVVSSQFVETGFAHSSGAATFVNSLLMSKSLEQTLQTRLMATGGGSMTLEATTVVASLLDCNDNCDATTRSGLLIATSNASIELKASAVGVCYPNFTPGAIVFREATGGNIFASTSPNPNWVQPVNGQLASDMRLILDQPALLVGAPGLPINSPSFCGSSYIYSAATPLLDDGAGTPGLLIDSVTDADTTNVLLNPIDNTPITRDVLGKPRTEASGTVRNIGAVQLGLAPTLNLTATGDSTADLNWTRPLDPSSGAITGYEVCFGTGTVPDPSALGTDCEDGDGNPASLETIASAPDTLAGQVTGLTNGETYWFLVRGVNVSGGGPWSNVVNGTPYGEIGMPSLTVTSTSCGSAFLEWTQPDLGGRTFSAYIVTWAIEGTGVALGSLLIDDYDTLSATVNGLDCNVRYRFAVTANTTDGATGGQGMGSVLVPPLPPVPALGQLGLLLLTLLVLSFGTVAVRRFG